MNFINSAPRPGAGGTPTTQASKGPYLELSMYQEVPTGEISLEEFEEYALDRLRGAWVLPSYCLEHSMQHMRCLACCSHPTTANTQSSLLVCCVLDPLGTQHDSAEGN
jgi:hypothetical protein